MEALSNYLKVVKIRKRLNISGNGSGNASGMILALLA